MFNVRNAMEDEILKKKLNYVFRIMFENLALRFHKKTGNFCKWTRWESSQVIYCIVISFYEFSQIFLWEIGAMCKLKKTINRE